MKTIKKILLTLCIIIIIIGMFLLGRNGLNYDDGYSKNILLETAKQYILYISVATIIILIYFVAKYSKQGIVKVIVTAILGILGAFALTISILQISTIAINRIFFPIMLVAYSSSILILTAYFEENN